MANSAATKKASILGVRIMIGGLAFQVFSMTIFVLVVSIFFLNVRRDQVQRKTNACASGKVDPPSQHIEGYSTFVIGTFLFFS